MNYRTLGRTGISVSEIGFGAWAIGGTSYGPTRDQDSLEALAAAWENGVNFFDTADTYGHGHSEELVGRFLKSKPRQKIFIATKAGWDFYHGGSRKNFDPDYLRFACGESLKRLGIDAIDLYQLHNPSRELLEQGECVGALEGLKKEGKIRFIGISVHTEAEALQAMKDARVDTLQLVFNILDQTMRDEVFAEAGKRNVGLIAREPLACGLLTGKYEAGHVFPKTDHRRRWPQSELAEELKKVEEVKNVLATSRVSLVQGALEYVLQYKEISTVIPGAKTPAHVLEHLQASKDPRLRSQELTQLRQRFSPSRA